MYLVRRSAVLAGVMALLAVAGVLDLVPPGLALTGFAAIGGAAWVWVARPYLKVEGMLTLFLEGYALSASEIFEKSAVSPASERLFEQLREVLNPTQLFEMNKRQAQYLALQNQINPHFLYNTLESIRSEALLAGLEEVADMTEALADFFRYTITKAENLVSVEDELLNCETYFNIQRYRFGSRIQMAVECAAEDKDEIYRCRLPKLTMQPILENCIIHGTELKVGTGHLTIHLERAEKRLLVRISDDGVGMDEETLARVNERLGKNGVAIAKQDQEARGGLALVNVDNRIRLLFGDEYGMRVFSLPGIGTDVEISLPAITSDRELPDAAFTKDAPV
jgi:two-component system sensor histidine kinase YesM